MEMHRIVPPLELFQWPTIAAPPVFLVLFVTTLFEFRDLLDQEYLQKEQHRAKIICYYTPRILSQKRRPINPTVVLMPTSRIQELLTNLNVIRDPCDCVYCKIYTPLEAQIGINLLGTTFAER
jgi:hypothetical protein